MHTYICTYVSLSMEVYLVGINQENYGFEKTPKNFVIINNLKIRHRFIGTILTMPKTYSNI